jgi:biopolymer transport protein ExbB
MPVKNQSLLEWTYEALGWKYSLAFLILSFLLVGFLVMNILAVRRDAICPTDLVEGVEQCLAEQNLEGAAELIRNDDSMLGQVVASGLGKLEKGYDHAIEAMQIAGEEETMKVEHRLGYMALIGNIAPMVGLLGTVEGMVAAFTVIASRTTTPPPSELAKGISTALVTTLLGLYIAIPAIAIYNILRNRFQRMVLEVGNTSENLLEKFEDSVRK